MQRCRTTNDETTDCGLKNENVVLTIRNPQLPIRNFRRHQVHRDSNGFQTDLHAPANHNAGSAALSLIM